MTTKSSNVCIDKVRILEERCNAQEKEISVLKKQVDQTEVFRTITEKRDSAILILDQGEILYVNHAWCELHQVSAENAINRNISEFAPPYLSAIDFRKTFGSSNPSEMINFIEHAVESGRILPPQEVHQRMMNNLAGCYSQGLQMKKNGELRWMERHTSSITFAGREAVLSCGRDITDQVLSEQGLIESEARYRALFEQTMVCIELMGENGQCSFNRNVHELLGYTRKEYDAIRAGQADALQSPEEVNERHRRIIEQNSAEIFETKLHHKNGTLVDMLIHISPIKIGGDVYLQSISIDITDRKKAERLLRKAYDELEKRVAQRTVELKSKSDSLEQINTALTVLLKKREDDKNILEDTVLTNIQELVIPSVEKLKHTKLTQIQQSYLDILELNLQDVISPLLQKLSSKHLKLTPSEIRIANMIKLGKPTKEIATHLGVSDKTIEFHRGSIRKKLGISKEKVNLRSYLLTID